MKNSKVGNHALCAKAIKQELKKAYPLVKFSVKSDIFSCGSSVAIRWTNGPTVKQVKSISDKYKYGHVNGMEDFYEFSNVNKDLPQVKYISVNRDIDIEIFDKIFEYLQKNYAHFDTVKNLDETSNLLEKNWNCCTAREYIYRIIQKFDLKYGVNNLNLEKII